MFNPGNEPLEEELGLRSTCSQSYATLAGQLRAQVLRLIMEAADRNVNGAELAADVMVMGGQDRSQAKAKAEAPPRAPLPCDPPINCRSAGYS